MAIIRPDPASLTTLHLMMVLSSTGSTLANGTGFIYAKGGNSYIVTNWHNVSGRNPETGACLSETKGVPDQIAMYFRDISNPGNGRLKRINLYSDEQSEIPAWYEHPVHGRKVDVVAIPISPDIVGNYYVPAINHIKFDEITSCVGDDAFVVGYPFSEHTYGHLPIWKRASIASEPDVDIDHLPKLLVDTATRPGLSGSPVILRRTGIHGMVDGQMSKDTIIGEVRSFIGVYSGRVGADDLKAQLGIVWKASVIEEIIDAAKCGENPHFP